MAKILKSQNKKDKENLDGLKEIIQMEMLKLKTLSGKTWENLEIHHLTLSPFGEELAG